MTEPLSSAFFDRPVLEVARELLGCRLVRQMDGRRAAVLITETEAYRGEEDLACHARSGRTERNAMLYGKPGLAYVYFTYGMHWLLNCVTGPEGFPAAVLLRAALPVDGLDWIAANRAGRKPAEWCSGPARLTRALGVDGGFNGCDLTRRDGGLWIEAGQPVANEAVSTGPRVGVDYAPEPWRSLPWRFTATIKA